MASGSLDATSRSCTSVDSYPLVHLTLADKFILECMHDINKCFHEGETCSVSLMEVSIMFLQP